MSRRVQLTARRRAVFTPWILLGVVACGGSERPHDASLEAPEARESRIALSPALDVSTLLDPALADRIIIDEITINLSDLRLLGSNPMIPAGGFPLIREARALSASEADTPLSRFPFPSSLLGDDLAVYVRIDTSPILDGASVVVSARLFETPLKSGARGLEHGEDEAPNPDGEPADEEAPNPDGEPANEEAPNPDGEPAKGGGEAPNPDGEPARTAPNPDGEPARCVMTRLGCVDKRKAGLTESISKERAALSFELRGNDVEDLVVGFDRGSRLNVVLGIPAGRWFTREVIAELERALDDLGTGRSSLGSGREAPGDRRTVIIERDPSSELGGETPSMPTDGGEYRLVEDDSVDPRDLRQH